MAADNDLRFTLKMNPRELAALAPNIVKGDKKGLLVGLAKILGGETAASITDALLAWRNRNDRTFAAFLTELERKEGAAELGQLVAECVLGAAQNKLDRLWQGQEWIAGQLEGHSRVLMKIYETVETKHESHHLLTDLESLIERGASAAEMKAFLGTNLAALLLGCQASPVLVDFVVGGITIDVAAFSTVPSFSNAPGVAYFCSLLDSAADPNEEQYGPSRARLGEALDSLYSNARLLNDLLEQRDDYRGDRCFLTPRGIVYGGRRHGLSKAALVNIQKLNATSPALSVLTYDSLLDQARQAASQEGMRRHRPGRAP